MSRRASTRLGAAFIGTPSYPPEPADLATFRLLGLELPIRATAAIVVMVVVMLIDFPRDFLPDAVVSSRDPAVLRIATLQRFVLLVAVPLAVVVLLFRDHPKRYGLRVGDWRAGTILAGPGAGVMLPLVVWGGHPPALSPPYAPRGKDLPPPAFA